MSPALMFWIQFILVLGAILIGIRKGGVALGLIGGLGVAVLVLGFRVAPGVPPIDVMLIILAVVTASATLQVAGGLDYLVQLTERVLRAHPKQVTILAPLSTFLLTVCVGTGLPPTRGRRLGFRAMMTMLMTPAKKRPTLSLAVKGISMPRVVTLASRALANSGSFMRSRNSGSWSSSLPRL